MNIKPGFLSLIFLSALAPVAQAQPSPFREAEDNPVVDARLDPLLAAHDWRGLSLTLGGTPTDLKTTAGEMDWLKRKVDTGGNFLLAYLYARDLWMLSLADPQFLKLRKNAGFMALYAVDLIAVDGTACEDRTAPAHRLDQMREQLAPIFQDVQTLSKDEKVVLVMGVAAMEHLTAPRREPHDDAVCRGGMAEIQAGLAANNVSPPEQLPNRIGRTVTVTAPPEWKPSFRSDEDYKPEQKKTATAMVPLLLDMIGVKK
ncbi:MAG: hypothetical protein J0H61_01070 [Alphaproteobacteria bacterium]|nr:hypothetical protein [Alphaproteobacteria bacterium]